MCQDGGENVPERGEEVVVEKLVIAAWQLPTTLRQTVRTRLPQEVSDGGFREKVMVE